MCIAILNKATTPISKESLLNCWTYNDDGAGLMWTNGLQMQMQKFPNDNTPGAFEDFYRKYLEVRSETNLPIGIHFRIATHGMSEKYLHPFPVSNSLFIMHNGIIHGLGTTDVSDTSMFADVLRDLGSPFNNSIAALASPSMRALIEKYLTVSNKVVALDSLGDYAIFNESAGHWLDDNWYSNDSYKEAKRYYGSYTADAYYGSYGSKWYDYDPKDDFTLKSSKGIEYEQYDEIVYWNTNEADYGIGDYYMNQFEQLVGRYGEPSTWAIAQKLDWEAMYSEWEAYMNFSDDSTETDCPTCVKSVIPTSKGECPSCLNKIAAVYYA